MQENAKCWRLRMGDLMNISSPFTGEREFVRTKFAANSVGVFTILYPPLISESYASKIDSPARGECLSFMSFPRKQESILLKKWIPALIVIWAGMTLLLAVSALASDYALLPDQDCVAAGERFGYTRAEAMEQCPKFRYMGGYLRDAKRYNLYRRCITACELSNPDYHEYLCATQRCRPVHAIQD